MNIRDFPITECDSYDNQLEEDHQTLETLLFIQQNFEERARAEMDGRELPAFMVCEDCGEHATIVCKNGILLSNLRSKASAHEAIEMLHDDNQINLSEKIRLDNEVETSSLPELSDFEISKLN